jgi:hypothetical protein
MTTPEDARREIADFCERQHETQVRLLAGLVKVP